MCDATDDDLLDEKDAVAGLVHDTRLGPSSATKTNKPTSSMIDRYRYPQQEMEIRRGHDSRLAMASSSAEVVNVDRVARTIDVKKGKSQLDNHPSAVFSHKHIGTGVLEDAIAAVGDAVATSTACDNANGIARALLNREPPRLTKGTFKQPSLNINSGSNFAVEVVTDLDNSVLAIQGPPGSGKTYTGARMICALVAQGKRVGVMASSHKVITNLLVAVSKESAKHNTNVRIAQKSSNDDDAHAPAGIVQLDENDEARLALDNREADVLGGTAFMWARPEFANAVDVLFVDEAGQVSLANAIAVSAAAHNMVMLGDPQQLDQPQQGSHPDGVELSALNTCLEATRRCRLIAASSSRNVAPRARDL